MISFRVDLDRYSCMLANDICPPPLRVVTMKFVMMHILSVETALVVKSEIQVKKNTGLILGLRPANERRRYKVTPSLIGWAQNWNQPWNIVIFRNIHLLSVPSVGIEGL